MAGRVQVPSLNPNKGLPHKTWCQFLPRGSLPSLLPAPLGQGMDLGRKELDWGGGGRSFLRARPRPPPCCLICLSC